MKQYIQLVKDIKKKGTQKPAARKGMPGSKSLFGYQMRFDMADGFPILTTKKVSFKNIAVELLWFLKGDTNIKYLLDHNINIWNGDAYNFYLSKHKKVIDALPINDPFVMLCSTPMSQEEFIDAIKKSETKKDLRHFEKFFIGEYYLGDCGYQYGKVWRDWTNMDYWLNGTRPMITYNNIDQIKNLLEQLATTPESRRHILTAVDPAHDKQLALYWCHSMAQFNCRPLTSFQRENLYAIKNKLSEDQRYEMNPGSTDEEVHKLMDDAGIPKFYLDLQLYQRSADTPLGVPYNIASYALLLSIFAKVLNMVPGEFIHTFGDVHIYDNQYAEIDEQISREPLALPTLEFSDKFEQFVGYCETGEMLPEDILMWIEGNMLTYKDFKLNNYQAHESIKYELSTGTV